MSERPAQIRSALLAAYQQNGLWGMGDAVWPLPPGIEKRGSDPHLAYLTLVFAISGGREPLPLWTAAQETYAQHPDLFDPHTLAFARSQDLAAPLRKFRLTRKVKSEAAVWQRIGQALVMRANGSVSQLLAAQNYDAQLILAMLQGSKTTFPVLSGPQTAPRWLWGMATAGDQPLQNASRLTASPSPAAKKALANLDIPVKTISAEVFAAVDGLGRYGCRQRRPSHSRCPAAAVCPVSHFCQYGRAD